MTTEEYIAANAAADTATLALRGAPQGIDLPFALRQIEGRQTALRKLPRWVATHGLLYPVRLSMQQCSSQDTAEYKAQVVRSLGASATRHLIDLTGGLGVDFSFMAPLFGSATYVERDSQLCHIASHNMPLLGLPRAQVLQAEAGASTLPAILDATPSPSLIYLDPARRDEAGRKVVRIEDCTPNLVTLLPRLLEASPWVMAKLSPMLDISQALRSLPHVSQVHVVGAEGECKELLLVIQRGYDGEPVMHCAPLSFTRADELGAVPTHSDVVQAWLYDPSPAMMKAAPFRLLSRRYGVAMLHPDSHLYTSPVRVEGFPGRTFRVEAVTDVKSFRRLYPGIKAAGITVRHYPGTPDTLRRRLKLKEGGSHQLVATTLPSGRHVLIIGTRSVPATPTPSEPRL